MLFLYLFKLYSVFFLLLIIYSYDILNSKIILIQRPSLAEFFYEKFFFFNLILFTINSIN